MKRIFLYCNIIFVILFFSCKPSIQTEYMEKQYVSAVTFVVEESDNNFLLVSMLTETSGAKIYYSTDESIPTTDSTEYTVGVTVNNDTTFKAIAVKDGFENSPISIAMVSIKEKTVNTTIENKDEITETLPTTVSNLTAIAKDTRVLLTWTDVEGSNIYGYEVSYSGEDTINRSIEALDKTSMVVPQGSGGTYISGLLNDIEYTFTVKTIDTSGNKSDGVSVNVIPVHTGNPLRITLKPGKTEYTNQGYNMIVEIDTAGNIQKVAYKDSFVCNAAMLFTDETSLILTESNEAYSFIVNKNGVYSVAVLDSDGREEIEWITVSNIDKVPPLPAESFVASYNYSSKTINFSWKEPADFDYSHLIILSGEELVAKVEKGTTSFTINQVDADGIERTYTAVTYDKFGNFDEEKQVSSNVIPIAGANVSEIILSRTHLTYDDTNQNIDVTIKGSDFNMIGESDSIIVQIRQGSSIKSTTNAVIDRDNNIAHATIIAPGTSSSVEGTTYTVYAFISEQNSGKTVEFIVSNSTYIRDFSLSLTQIAVADVTDASFSRATIKGTNLDLVSYKIELYDSVNNLYASYDVDTSSFDLKQKGDAEKTISFDIPVPKIDDYYTVKLYYGQKIYEENCFLQVYGLPVFSSFSVPGTWAWSDGFRYVTATAIGKNFKAPGVLENDFYVACNENSRITSAVYGAGIITVISDSKLTVKLLRPEEEGTFTVAMSYGDEKKECLYKVHKRGDIDEDAEFVYVGGNETITDLYVCSHEVTQKEYESYCISSVEVKDGEFPAYSVSWFNAIIYCNLRSIDEGLAPVYIINDESNPSKWSGITVNAELKYSGPYSDLSWSNIISYDSTANGYRLPTSNEWSYIASEKGASSNKYSGSNNIDDVAWYRENSDLIVHEIKCKSANSLGIYDMSGNVWEWCYDLYQGYKSKPYFRVLRGGSSWSDEPSLCEVSGIRGDLPVNGVGYPDGYYSEWYGFRVVRNAY